MIAQQHGQFRPDPNELDHVKELMSALNYRPADDRIWNALGKKLSLLGARKEALYCFQKALALNQGNKQALYNLASLPETTNPMRFTVNLYNNTNLKSVLLSIDLYSVHNPMHPEGHLGYWNKQIPLSQNKNSLVRIDLSLEKKVVLFDGCLPDEIWINPSFTSNNLEELKCYILLYNAKREIIAKKFVSFDLLAADSQFSLKLSHESRSKLKSALWFITWNCNFRCIYCWEEHRRKKKNIFGSEYIPSYRWVEVWNKLRPGLLDITGGEPFLQPDFVELLEGLDDSISIGITTNASKDLTQFVQRIHPEKITSITLSFHLLQGVTSETLLGKCLMLKNRGFNVVVNYLAWPEQLWLIPTFKEFFEKNGIRFHVDPYDSSHHYPYLFNRKEKEFLSSFISEDRKHFLSEEKLNVKCSAGCDHLCVIPNGDAYRCLNDKLNGKASLGNIFDPSFALNNNWVTCADYNVCANCDRDKVSVRVIDLEE
ncbi:MAG: radical SAM protein [Nitrososphaeria archaeon]